MKKVFVIRLLVYAVLLAGYSFYIPYYAIGQQQMPPPDNLQAILDQDEGEPTQIHLTWEYDTGLEGFQGFIIFQNGDTLNENLTQSLSHTQTLYEEGTFVYQVQAIFENSLGSEISQRKIISNFEETYYDFEPGSGNPTADTWTIFVKEAKLGETFLSPGDEIAVFYGNKLVGANKLTIEPSDDSEGMNVIIAFSKLSDGPGYEPGEPFEFEFYDASMDQVYSIYDYDFSLENPNAYDGDVFPEGDDEISYLNIYFDISLAPPQITDIQTEGHNVTLHWEMNSSRDMIGYEVYRNSNKLNDEPVTETSYLDENVISGNYSYQIKALYDEGSTYFSDPEEVTIDLVFFNPEPVEELFEPMTLQIQQAQLMEEPLVLFDEIGVFKKTGEQEICISAKSLTEDFSSETLMLPTQNETSSGFEEGDTLYFRFYDYEQDLEFRDVMVSFPEGEQDTSGTFTPDGQANIFLEWLPYPPENLELEVEGYDVHLSWNENPENLNYAFNLEGYNIFRNQTQINENLVSSEYFVDSNIVIDDYTYYIEAAYDGVPSHPSSESFTSIAGQNYSPVQEETAGGNMQFNITQAWIDGEQLINYDQVAVFTKNENDSLICVGAGSVRDSATLEAPLTFTAYKNNPNTEVKDGFADGDSIYYKFWDESTNNVYQYFDVSFPYNDESGFNHTHFMHDTTCYINLIYTTPLPVEFSFTAEEEYCTGNIEQIYLTTQHFKNIRGLSFFIKIDTANYAVDSVIPHQSFLENSETEIYSDTLAIHWEKSTGYTLENTDTIYIIQIQPLTSAETGVEWLEASSFLGMDYQSATYSDDAFYIETIPPAPATISGDNEVCNGTAFSQYSITEINNADTYTWHLTNEEAGTLSPSGISATIFWNSEFDGQTILTAASTNMCGTSDSAQKNITITNTVFADVMISVNSGNGCEGDTIQIEATAINGGNNPVYDWYINDDIHSVHQPILTRTDFEDGDEVYCVLTSSNECAQNNPAQSETIELDLEQLPSQPGNITGPELICNTVLVSYYTTAGAQNAEDYVWNITPSETGEVIPDGNVAEVHWNTDVHGPAYVTVRGINSCGTGPIRQIITVREYCTDIASVNQEAIEVYPNPATESVTIGLPVIPETATYQIFDLRGTVLKEDRFRKKVATMNLSSLPRGIYVLKLKLDDEVFYRKVIKQ